MKNRVLVTGACGFIGTHTTKKLVESGYVVHCVDDMSGADYEFFINQLNDYHVRTVPVSLAAAWEQQIEKTETADIVVFEGDFCSPLILRRLAQGFYDTVVHLAAHPSVQGSVDHPVSTYDNNFSKAIELFYLCAKVGTKVVFASSAAVYGNSNLTAEDSLPAPASPYALQKFQAEQVASLFSELYGLTAITLRFFNVYGPGQKGNSPYSTVIASWTDKIKNNLPLRVDGDGEQTRDYIHVYDVARACESAMLLSESTTLNIASGRSVSNNNILSMLKSHRDFKVENAPPRQGDIKHSLAVVEKAKEKIGFETSVQLKDGIERLLRLGHGTNE